MTTASNESITAGIIDIDRAYTAHVEGDDDTPRAGNHGGAEARTSVFTLRAYCWCDGEGEHADGCPPNFVHHASGLEVSWYKHAGRGLTVSRDIPLADWHRIVSECLHSITERPPAYRVLITGSREWGAELFERFRLRDDWASVSSPQRDAMVEALRGARERAGDRHIVVVHGAARGADTLAAVLAQRAPNSHPQAWPAIWRPDEPGEAYDRTKALFHWEDRSRPVDKRAGFTRNEAMVAAGADECLAFFAEGAGNGGTAHCARTAAAAGIPVREVRA